MVSLLLIISFLLHIVLLIAIYFLYQQLELVKRSKNEQVEAVLDSFLTDIKTENERLQNELQQKDGREEMFIYPEKRKERVRTETIEDDVLYKLNEREGIVNTPTPKIPTAEKVDKLETSLTAQVFQLARAGMPADEIAKKLNRGKTEIELMLKLQSKG